MAFLSGFLNLWIFMFFAVLFKIITFEIFLQGYQKYANDGSSRNICENDLDHLPFSRILEMNRFELHFQVFRNP